MVGYSKLFVRGEPPSKSGFLQARAKIKIIFFHSLFKLAQQLFYSDNIALKKWKGYFLIAVDGTAFRVPDTIENRKGIGVHENQHGGVAACKALAFHDVLNRVFRKVILHPRSKAELVAMHESFDDLPEQSITIYDRHYCDSLLLDRHLKEGKPCVIRMKTKGINIVRDFLKSGNKEEDVEFQIGERAYYSARDRYGLKNHHPRFSKFKIRLIKVILDNGTIEVLATTLFDRNKFPHADFKELYAKRWGVETAFDEVKNQLKLALFSGYKEQFVRQDIWAVFVFYNIRALFLFESEKNLQRTQPNYQVNRNIAVAIIKANWADILLKKTTTQQVASLIKSITRYREKIRIRPPTERKRKVMRANERYMTEKNYKPAF